MSETPFKNRTDLSRIQNNVEKMKAELKKVIIGQDELLHHLMVALLSNGHVLLEGVPGVAKTVTVKLLAKIISTGFSRIQLTPDLMPSDIVGTVVFNHKTAKFEFKKGPVFSNLILADEINRAPAKTQSALLEVMEERQVTVDHVSYQMAAPFIVIATQNPIEYEGTYRLPEAQLDRFLFKINVNYPSVEHEEQMLAIFHENRITDELACVNTVLKAKDIITMQKTVQEIVIDRKLIHYITEIVHQTRHHASLFLGGSPRASLNLMQSSKALAALQGRDFVIPEDIQALVFPVLRHRVILIPEKEMQGIQPDEILKHIIEQIEVPR